MSYSGLNVYWTGPVTDSYVLVLGWGKQFLSARVFSTWEAVKDEYDRQNEERAAMDADDYRYVDRAG